MDNKEKIKNRGKSWKNTNLKRKVYVTLILILIGTVLIGLFLNDIQTSSALKKQRDNNNLALTEVVSLLEKNQSNSENLTQTYHDGNWKMIDDIDLLFTYGLLDKVLINTDDVRSMIFEELASSAGVSYLYLLSEDGRIMISPDDSLVGRNPASTTHMTQENLNAILKQSTLSRDEYSPVLVKNQHGTFYFYSKPYSYNGVSYILAIGSDSKVIDNSVSSLTDVSAVLSRMGVINDGFLFAIDKNSELFLHYKSDTDFLSGQNAFNTGLDRNVMEDGYQGRQTILGERYYCSSKALGSDVIVVAAARSNTVLSHDKYVLVWSILGFIMVMVLCLVYATIVGNDFLRQGTMTDRVVINNNSSNPIYFNRPVFRKVLPLMMLGIISVYGVSFYTQTLPEISEGVDKSDIILKEVNGRYEESMESRSVIADYNNSRFLSTARLIRFYLEENPDVLNEASDHLHSYYDDDGNKRYILDDEGNPLKSISYSRILQYLCDENNIDAIYMFDENGRTIATNTQNWFFTISRNENDQSYPFLQVLEGKLDSYMQELMTDDLGEEAQFYGITMNYYTKKDDKGNTVYVSRYAFEEAMANEGVSGVRKAGGITKHTSLMQIELDESLVDSIMVSTSAEYVLSTEMLSGGSIVIFDTSRDHLCVYSPVGASIGKSAEELGVSEKAFSGSDYFGFSRVNGVNYFTMFRYIDDYFIATAIPKSSMFTSRTKISLITAGVSMVLIVIMMVVINFVSKEEEEVYEEMLSGYEDNDLNSSFFDIILPSGRSVSTQKAQIRWDNRHIPWKERSPEMKLGTIMGWIMAIPILYFLISALRINRISEEHSIVRYIFSGAWDRSPNVFALSACILVLIVTVLSIEIFRIPVRLFTALLGTRGETVGHLLLSIIKYGGTIGSIFYCLYLLGIDSANLLASAGIISLVIGLGAQSLIKDIIAGIFIVFEGEFRVGDIVTINGFRGTVSDIGLRTTKIVGEGNVKIFNN
ncbi:MAG: mechanosensitive ion channel, partial [Erysipelotrichaceae bacterium]|nr:mechanosensitive ion channel [Erysipelotrichaceae bacterium]